MQNQLSFTKTRFGNSFFYLNNLQNPKKEKSFILLLVLTNTLTRMWIIVDFALLCDYYQDVENQLIPDFQHDQKSVAFVLFILLLSVLEKNENNNKIWRKICDLINIINLKIRCLIKIICLLKD